MLNKTHLFFLPHPTFFPTITHKISPPPPFPPPQNQATTTTIIIVTKEGKIDSPMEFDANEVDWDTIAFDFGEESEGREIIDANFGGIEGIDYPTQDIGSQIVVWKPKNPNEVGSHLRFSVSVLTVFSRVLSGHTGPNIATKFGF